MDNLEELLWYRSESQKEGFLENVLEEMQYLADESVDAYICLYDNIDKIYINQIEC